MENTIINVAGFNKNSITDGPGFRFVIFAQGCVHGCKGCHNPETHSFGTGTDYSAAEIIAMIKKNPMIKGVTLSGGDPFCQAEAFAKLSAELKKHGYEICAFTGYLFEKLIEDKADAKYKLLENVDILIDGPFIESEKSLELRFKGSRNQRTIDVAKSLAEGKAVLSDSPRWT
ncbi:MAG: anaerobic ribonucleoside-triphosphate reductase activating protein [Oscillospiraceae bacterium]|nr:anaerobic ribonucleoside-triphosphate reductase activating protein [Oscillospiraceae bacterium]